MEREHDMESRAPAGRLAGRARVELGELVAVFAGGFVGAIARAAVARGLPATPGTWPWATFAVNIAGALVLGCVVTYLQERRAPSRYLRALLGAGLCGALTTFSTMMLELLGMIEAGGLALAAAYAGASVGCGLAAVLIATSAVRRVWPR